MTHEDYFGEKHLRESVVEFQERRNASLSTLCDVLRILLGRVRDDYAPTAIVEVRVKSASSFAEKCLRKRYSEPFRETTDLCAGRIVCPTLKEKRALRDALTTLFQPVDEYENTTWRHDADSFGYRGYHMVVHFSPQVVQRIARRWAEFATFPEDVLCEGGKFEIQLRTFLEHAHADITHDRLYKAGFDISKVLMRKSAIVAAQLESADKQLQQFVDAVEEYSAGAAATMKSGMREKEIKCLEALLQPGLSFPDHDVLLARMIRLHRASWNWEAVIASLEEIGGPDGGGLSPELAGELGHAIFRMGVAKRQPSEIERAAKIMTAASVRARTAFEERRREHDAHILARLLQWQGIACARLAGRRDEAVQCLREAHRLLPGDPFILVSLVKEEWAANGTKPSDLALSLLEGAAVRCIRLAKAGIDIVSAWLELAQIRLLQCDRLRSFAAIALAAEAGASPEALSAVAEEFARIRDLPGSDKSLKTLSEHLEASAKLVLIGRKPVQPGQRNVTTVLLSGNTAGEFEDWMDAKGECLVGAFENFPGTVRSGGSPHGVCKIALRCAEKAADGGAVRFFGYLPRQAPALEGLDASQVVRTCGTDYTILEPLQMWKDVFASGQTSENVILLCLGGGKVSFEETMLAVAIGADVYFLGDGRKDGAASALEETIEEAGAEALPHLHMLPDDDATLSMFQPWKVSCRADATGPCEILARKIHESYVRSCMGSTLASNLAPWEELREDFKFSNIHQAWNAIQILSACGYGVRSLTPGEGRPVLPDISRSVEKMSRMEHGRWNMERLMQGWRHGNVKDRENRISPCIAPWEALTEEVKDYDRRAVCGWPELLLDAGLVIYEKNSDCGGRT